MITPHFIYDLDLLNTTLTEIKNQINGVDYKIHYAIKANHNTEILTTISDFGLGADCVSGQEIIWALNSGFKAEDIVYAGVGKTDEEIVLAIKNKIGIIHCEGLEELKAINEIAVMMGEYVDVALRVNPDLNAATHQKITTGLKDNKFGFSELELNKLIDSIKEYEHINIKGLHFHIGSQINDMMVFRRLCDKINAYCDFFNKHIGLLTYLNVGGGLGIDYHNPDENAIPDFKSYFNVFKSNLKLKKVAIHFELGRSIVGQCGQLKTKVLYIKSSKTKQFAVVDAGMTELLRPALYNAYHKIDYQGISFIENSCTYDIVGPICESSDCLGTNVKLPLLKRGDTLLIKSCGAYAESMSLNYNGRKKIESVFVS